MSDEEKAETAEPVQAKVVQDEHCSREVDSEDIPLWVMQEWLDG